MASATGYGRRTYRAYVPHRLANWKPVLGVETVKSMSSADLALSEVASLPQSGISGAIASWMTARDESIRSSIIEGIESTGSGLAWAQYMNLVDRPVSDENDALTLGATRQLTAAVELGARIASGEVCTTDDILALHSKLFEGTREQDIGGILRTSPVWIGPPGSLVEHASFVPPPDEYVALLLEDLVDYLNDSDHPPVLKAAVVHSQFETIHPFDDGNGRTGRALLQTVLNATGAAHGTLPISTVLSTDRAGYYQALTDTRVVCAEDDDVSRSNGLRRWLHMFCRSCQEAHREAEGTVRAAEALTDHWRSITRFRSGSTAADLLLVLPTMPVLDAGLVSKRLGVTERAARDALRSLASVGIVSRTGGRRNGRFVVPAIVDTLQQRHPDGGIPNLSAGFEAARLSTPPITGVVPQPTPVMCAHIGPRSGKRCTLPKGHQGRHRY